MAMVLFFLSSVGISTHSLSGGTGIAHLIAKVGKGPASYPLRSFFQSVHYRTVEQTSYPPTAESARLQASSQRLHASAHTRQCSMFISVAWYSHSSAHKRHASAHAWRAALAIAGSNSVGLERILPVVA